MDGDDRLERAREVSRRLHAFEADVARAAGVANAANGALVALAARAMAEGMWEGWKIHTPEQWLTLKMGVDRATARKVVRIARRHDELPVTVGLLARGQLSLDQATTIARFVPADYEGPVCVMAPSATVAQLRRVTSAYGYDVDQAERDARADADKRPRGPRREVRFGANDSDEWTMRAVLPAEEGALIEDVLKDQRDRLHTVARQRAKEIAAANGRPATGTDADLGVDQPSWADALVGVASVAADSERDGDSVTERTGVLVHLRAPDAGDGDAGDGEAGAARWRAEMHMGPTLPDAVRRYLTCECDIEIVWERDGTPVQVGRTHRGIPRRVRRLIMHRDKGCRVPGCTRQTFLHLHHIVHWEDNGETVTWNLITVCAHHHRLHHQGWLDITGNADATSGPDVVRFTFPTGELIGPAPHIPAPEPDELPRTEPYRGPTGEPLQERWVHFDRARDGVAYHDRYAHVGQPRPRP